MGPHQPAQNAIPLSRGTYLVIILFPVQYSAFSVLVVETVGAMIDSYINSHSLAPVSKMNRPMAGKQKYEPGKYTLQNTALEVRQGPSLEFSFTRQQCKPLQATTEYFFLATIFFVHAAIRARARENKNNETSGAPLLVAKCVITILYNLALSIELLL